MPDVKNQKEPITLDKERNICFDMNAFVELEKHYGSMDGLQNVLNEIIAGKGTLTNIRKLLYIGLLHEDESLTENKVGKIMDFDKLPDIAGKIVKALLSSLPRFTEKN